MLAASLGGAPQALGQRTENGPRDRIQALLDGRAEAVLRGDKAAFMASVDPSATAFAAAQERLFDGLQDVPLDGYKLVARWDHYGDLARRSDARRYRDADEVMIPVTEERYRIAGFDDSDAIEDLFYTYVRRGDRWLIASDTDLDDLALRTARHLWDFGPVESDKSAGFLVLRHSCGPSSCATLPSWGFAALGDARRQMRHYWPQRGRGRVVILLPSTETELEAMLDASFDLAPFVAFAYSTLDVRKGADYTGGRMVLNAAALAGRSQEDVTGIFAHELLHVATRAASGPFVPIFVEEGFADYVGKDADPSALAFLRSEIAAGRFDRRLPEDYEFTTGDEAAIFRSYLEAHSAARFLVERWGLDKLIAFYERLGGPEIAPGTTRYHVDRALRASVGVGLRRFEREWAEALTS